LLLSMSTGCAVTLCSALSQGSCWSLNDLGGRVASRGRGRVHCWKGHLRKVFGKIRVDMSGQMPRGGGALPWGLAFPDICYTAWVSRRGLFSK
jgi:hypothetical protein